MAHDDGNASGKSGGRRQLHAVSSLFGTQIGGRDRSPRRVVDTESSENPVVLTTHVDDDDGATHEGDYYKVVKSILQQELGSSLPQPITKGLRRVTTRFMTRVEKLQSTISLIEKTNAEIKELEAGRVPNSCRKFGFSFETDFLDIPCTLVGTDDIKVSVFSRDDEPVVSIGAGSTFRQAKETLYRAQLLDQRRLDLLVYDAHRSRLVRLTTYKSFKEECDSETGATDTAIHGIGIEVEERLWRDFTPPILEAQVIKVYKKTVETLGKQQLLKMEEESRDKKKKQSVLDAVKKEKPIDHLQHLVDDRIDSRLGKKIGRGKGRGSEYTVDYKQLIEGSVSRQSIDYDSVMTKNATSPAAEGAKSSAGKPKAKSKAVAKAKARAKAEPKSKGKGKSKDGKRDSRTPTKSSGKGKTDAGKAKGKGKNKRG